MVYSGYNLMSKEYITYSGIFQNKTKTFHHHQNYLSFWMLVQII